MTDLHVSVEVHFGVVGAHERSDPSCEEVTVRVDAFLYPPLLQPCGQLVDRFNVRLESPHIAESVPLCQLSGLQSFSFPESVLL